MPKKKELMQFEAPDVMDFIDVKDYNKLPCRHIRRLKELDIEMFSNFIDPTYWGCFIFMTGGCGKQITPWEYRKHVISVLWNRLKRRCIDLLVRFKGLFKINKSEFIYYRNNEYTPEEIMEMEMEIFRAFHILRFISRDVANDSSLRPGAISWVNEPMETSQQLESATREVFDEIFGPGYIARMDHGDNRRDL